VAWVRRVRTASGATAVQIAESVGGRRRIVRHVGSARDEAELGLLMEQARQLLVDDAQGVLDLGITPAVRKTVMVPLPTAPALFGGSGDGPVSRSVVPAARVLKTSSGLLHEALAGVYTSLGLDRIADAVFRDLVIARIAEPTSLLDVDRVLAELGRVSVSLSTRKRTLRRAHTGAYRDQVAAACYAHASTSGDVSLCLYDVTTLYFEAEKEDDLRKVGFSKERRVDPQIVVGLLVDRQGFPLETGCFEGNKAETHTLIPIISAFQARHGIADLVIVADAGMLSAANLKALDQVLADKGYIGAGAGIHTPVKHRPDGPLHIDNRCYNQLITALRAPAERGNALLGRWRALDRVTVCPQRIGAIAAAALVLTSLDRGTR
jgi:hypothetical protein